MRSDTRRRGFFPWKTKKKMLSAARIARLVINIDTAVLRKGSICSTKYLTLSPPLSTTTHYIILCSNNGPQVVRHTAVLRLILRLLLLWGCFVFWHEVPYFCKFCLVSKLRFDIHLPTPPLLSLSSVTLLRQSGMVAHGVAEADLGVWWDG